MACRPANVSICCSPALVSMPSVLSLRANSSTQWSRKIQKPCEKLGPKHRASYTNLTCNPCDTQMTVLNQHSPIIRQLSWTLGLCEKKCCTKHQSNIVWLEQLKGNSSFKLNDNFFDISGNYFIDIQYVEQLPYKPLIFSLLIFCTSTGYYLFKCHTSSLTNELFCNKSWLSRNKSFTKAPLAAMNFAEKTELLIDSTCS